jgi:hypothetical protein
VLTVSSASREPDETVVSVACAALTPVNPDKLLIVRASSRVASSLKVFGLCPQSESSEIDFKRRTGLRPRPAPPLGSAILTLCVGPEAKRASMSPSESRCITSLPEALYSDVAVLLFAAPIEDGQIRT